MPLGLDPANPTPDSDGQTFELVRTGAGGNPTLPGTPLVAPAGMTFHRSINPTEFAGVALAVELPTEAEKLEIFAAAGDPVYISWSNAGVSAGVGSYDLYHPGGGELCKPAPAGVRRIFVYAGVAGTPAAPIEIYAYAGPPARIPL